MIYAFHDDLHRSVEENIMADTSVQAYGEYTSETQRKKLTLLRRFGSRQSERPRSCLPHGDPRGLHVHDRGPRNLPIRFDRSARPDLPRLERILQTWISLYDYSQHVRPHYYQRERGSLLLDRGDKGDY